MADFISIDKVDWLWRVFLAQLLIFLFFLVDVSNVTIMFLSKTNIPFLLIAIYCWSVYRPSLLHPLLLFVYGFLIDLVLFFPLGFHAIVFLLSQYFIRSQRSFFLGQPYLMFWLGFAVFLALILCVEFLFFSVVRQSIPDFKELIFGYIISLLLFPLISFVFLLLNKIMPVTDKD